MKMEWTRIRILRFVFSVSYMDFAIMLLVGLCKCMISASGVFLTRDLFSAIETITVSGITYREYVLFVVYAGYLLCMSAFQCIFSRYIVQFKMVPRFEKRMLEKIHKKARSISSEQMQIPEIERLIRQTNGARQALFRYGEICVTICVAVIQTVVVTLSISSMNMWYLLFMPMAFIASMIKQWQQSRLLNKHMQESAQCRREEDTFEKAVLDEYACKETRVCNAATLLMGKWEGSRNRRDQIEDDISKKLSLFRWLLLPLDLVGRIAGIIVSSILMWKHIIPFSVFTAGVNGYDTLLGSYQQLLSLVGHQKQYYAMLQPFFQYWSYPERQQGVAKQMNPEKITLKGVSFRYPTQRNWALRNINIVLYPGETLAIVGENGAGKTTLARLISGLYQPTEGVITYGNIDLLNISEEQLHADQSVVDQNFCRYKLSAEDNIVLGDIHKVKDKNSIHRVLEDILHSPSTDVLLGREFGGIDLSGGQWQRLACARGFYKDAKMLILDEPTSAIDALQEKRMYDEFAYHLQGKTGIIITHRLGAVRLADHIVVLSHGEIVESGTHDELIKRNGLYTAMWEGQAEQYE